MGKSTSVAQSGSAVLDDLDHEILDLLRADGRASLAWIGRQVGLSKPGVKYRIDRLARQGVIKGFFVLIDAQAYGSSLSVLFDLEVEPRRIEEVAERIASLEEVTRTYELSNSPQLHVHAHFANQSEMERFLKDKLYPLPWITGIRTGIIMKRYKYEASLTV